MKVFISWSGDRSKAVAELLATWIPEVLQGVYCWVSNKDIDKGAIWFDEIQSTLADVNAGIICVTRDNLDAPWLLFEAGALSKGLSKKRVIPVLIDLKPSDVRAPVGQFNCSGVSNEEMLQLILTLKRQRVENPLSDEQAKKAFNRCWPEFEEGFKKVMQGNYHPANQVKRSNEDLMAEILEVSRSIQRQLQERWNTAFPYQGMTKEMSDFIQENQRRAAPIRAESLSFLLTALESEQLAREKPRGAKF